MPLCGFDQWPENQQPEHGGRDDEDGKARAVRDKEVGRMQVPSVPYVATQNAAYLPRGSASSWAYLASSTQYGRTQVIGSRSSGSIQPAWQSRQMNESAIHSVSCHTSGWISSRSRVCC